MEGTASQISDIGSRFDFITKNEMRTKTSIKMLRHCSQHIYHKNNQLKLKYFGFMLTEIFTFKK